MAPERLHQEDFCQVTNRSPDSKYEQDGGPSLRDIVEVLQVQCPASVEPFLRAVTLNIVIGNGDAHAKNFSLLHLPTGAVELTPLYDLMSTVGYGATKLAMYVDDVRQIAKATGARLVNEAARWGISKPRVMEVVSDMLDRIVPVVERTFAEIGGVPDTIPRLIDEQVANVRGTLGRNAD
jgi:serine/threonine-protein kinase HipA